MAGLVVGRDLFPEPAELVLALRELELLEGADLDLADALARDLEDRADLLERVGVAVAEAVAELEDFPLAVRERLQELRDRLAQHRVLRGIDRRLALLV